MNTSERLRKYFVMGSQDCDRDPLVVLDEAIAAGITAFQYREKGRRALAGGAKYKFGERLKERCNKAGVWFIVNDDLDLYQSLGADGIHVGQQDQSVSFIREAYPQAFIGLSVSNQEQLQGSPLTLVDYLGIGPIFPTNTKEDADPVVGPEWIREVKSQHPSIPLVGIGGIHAGNAYEVMEAGADGVAVVSAISKARDINLVVRQL
ncbi:thiamine phosphate synthase [Halobacillus litoralis]|uniref:thiamine phosphate synthase n=1 Tax=Halobacillus litoralis TaxID=45668 RepID=UPI001CFEA846|nr:thiamine phosphate synthase [Halobacillus litoralis]